MIVLVVVRSVGFYGSCCFGRGDRSEWAECRQEFARNVRGRIILGGGNVGDTALPWVMSVGNVGNVIGFGVVSDSGGQAGDGLVRVSDTDGQLRGGKKKKNYFFILKKFQIE